MPKTRSVHVLIGGRVQGVGYRAWTARQASALGLAGWVRNRADGTVEAVIVGDSEMVGAMLAACRVGPAGARVDSLSFSDTVPPADAGFLVLPTA